MMRDRTGDLLDQPPPADESKAAIRAALCTGPGACSWDHEHRQPTATRADASADDTQGERA